MTVVLATSRGSSRKRARPLLKITTPWASRCETLWNNAILSNPMASPILYITWPLTRCSRVVNGFNCAREIVGTRQAHNSHYHLRARLQLTAPRRAVRRTKTSFILTAYYTFKLLHNARCANVLNLWLDRGENIVASLANHTNNHINTI